MLREKALQTPCSGAGRGRGAEPPTWQCPSAERGRSPAIALSRDYGGDQAAVPYWDSTVATCPRAVGGDGESSTNSSHFPNSFWPGFLLPFPGSGCPCSAPRVLARQCPESNYVSHTAGWGHEAVPRLQREPGVPTQALLLLTSVCQTGSAGPGMFCAWREDQRPPRSLVHIPCSGA